MIEYINQTLLNSWSMCPERVRRRWIENEIIPPGIAARIGTGLHKGAEVNHKAKKETGEDEPLDTIKDAARDGYLKSLQDGVFFPISEVSTAKKQIAEGVDIAVNLASLYHDSLAPQIKPNLVEERISMDVDGLPLPFVGTVDVFTKDNWLPDLKTAARKWSQVQADSSIQATLYNELVKHHTGQYPAKLSFEIFTKTKTPAHQSVETTRMGEDFGVLIKRAQIMLNMIQAGIFPPSDPGFWGCSFRYCGYWWTCDHIPKHKKILPKRR